MRATTVVCSLHAELSRPTCTRDAGPRVSDVTLFHDGDLVETGRVEVTQAMIFSADETTDIGYESGTTVSSDYTSRTSRFSGKIAWVQIDLGDDVHDHYIDPDERFRIAMARQ